MDHNNDGNNICIIAMMMMTIMMMIMIMIMMMSMMTTSMMRMGSSDVGVGQMSMKTRDFHFDNPILFLGYQIRLSPILARASMGLHK